MASTISGHRCTLYCLFVVQNLAPQQFVGENVLADHGLWTACLAWKESTRQEAVASLSLLLQLSIQHGADMQITLLLLLLKVKGSWPCMMMCACLCRSSQRSSLASTSSRRWTHASQLTWPAACSCAARCLSQT